METTEEKHATHTPGPWGLSSSIHEEDHGDQEYLHIIAKKRMSDIGMIRVAKHNPIRTTDEANARLIASAPEMYQLLRKISNSDLGDVETAIQITLDARELLAKVDGGEG